METMEVEAVVGASSAVKETVQSPLKSPDTSSRINQNTDELDATTEPRAQFKRAEIIEHNSQRFKRTQKIHALAISVGPLLAFAVMFPLLPVGALELTLFGVMYYLTMVVGITVGYHRHFAHRSFQATQPVRVFLAICGCMAMQGSVAYWVSNHRRHHKYSDEHGDPHSPHVNEDNQQLNGGWLGFWHAHIGWMFKHKLTNTMVFSRDLVTDPVITKVSRYYFYWVALGLIVPALIGGIVSGTWLGLVSGFFWGGIFRLLFTFHATSSVNSITHLFGKRPFPTTDHSTNNGWLAIPSGGETWHNNHHAFPNSARFGYEWWQIDLGWHFIRLLEKLGLASNVKCPSKAARDKKAQQVI